MFEEHQGGAVVAEGEADRLRQCASGVQWGNQDHVVDIVGPQHFPQFPGRPVVGPRHTGRLQSVAALGHALPGSDDRRNHPLNRPGVDPMVVDGDPVRLVAFHEDEETRRRCHRHTEYDVHVASTALEPFDGSSLQPGAPLH